jgi:hypothetical protein
MRYGGPFSLAGCVWQTALWQATSWTLPNKLPMQVLGRTSTSQQTLLNATPAFISFACLYLCSRSYSLLLRTWEARHKNKCIELEDSEPQVFRIDHATMQTDQQNIEAIPRAAKCCVERRTVAIFADYDGCWDVISETNPLANEKVFQTEGARLERAIASITRGKKVILFVGSNRQSSRIDNFNNGHNRNGLALGKDGSFERWAEKHKTKGWSLNKALLSDGDTPFSSWGKDRPSPWGFSEKDEDLKVRIAENNFKYLNCTDKIDVFFFDDKADYLEHVRKTAKIPQHINFYTVHYDWYSYALEGNTKPIVAKGVDGSTYDVLGQTPARPPKW